MKEFNLKNESIQLNPENHLDVPPGGVYLESINVPVSLAPVSSPLGCPARGTSCKGTRFHLGERWVLPNAQNGAHLSSVMRSLSHSALLCLPPCCPLLPAHPLPPCRFLPGVSFLSLSAFTLCFLLSFFQSLTRLFFLQKCC